MGYTAAPTGSGPAGGKGRRELASCALCWLPGPALQTLLLTPTPSRWMETFGKAFSFYIVSVFTAGMPNTRLQEIVERGGRSKPQACEPGGIWGPGNACLPTTSGVLCSRDTLLIPSALLWGSRYVPQSLSH